MRRAWKAIFALTLGASLCSGAESDPRKNPELVEVRNRAKAYQTERNQLGETLPKLGDKAAPEQISQRKDKLRELVRAARADAKPGEILGAGAFEVVSAVRSETAGAEGRDARDTVLGAGNPVEEGKGFTPKVNAQYPEDTPRSTVPPDLLARLPELPEGLEFRFVGRTLILYDAEIDLIVDYVTGAVKGTGGK